MYDDLYEFMSICVTGFDGPGSKMVENGRHHNYFFKFNKKYLKSLFLFDFFVESIEYTEKLDRGGIVSSVQEGR
jgi:hypothetical protein